MIDSHCHLAAPQFADDVDAVIVRALQAGVERMVCIGDTIEESKRGVELAEKNEQIFCTVGIHPHHAKDWSLDTLGQLTALAGSSAKVKAIGEIGLDYHYNFSTPDAQRSAFASQIALAGRLNLPVVVHCREAVEDVWAIVREYPDLKLVIHCCTEKWDDVERFVDQGHLLSFTGIATYKNAEVIRDCIKACPLEKMMIETDAPFLAPVPHRGKRNEPAFVVEVAKLVAELKGVSLDEIDRVTTTNAVRFFELQK